jgi:putative ABC transport system substrate-binding protein
MRRRHFIHLVGGAVAWPMAVHVQLSTRRPLVAVLSGVTREGYARVSAFERGMRELGYVDGRNIDIEYRFADGWLERLPDLQRNWSDFRQRDHGRVVNPPLSR